jgi:uncharacterized repeat protein (TIGR03806 family)
MRARAGGRACNCARLAPNVPASTVRSTPSVHTFWKKSAGGRPDNTGAPVAQRRPGYARFLLPIVACGLALAAAAASALTGDLAPFGLGARHAPKAYLNMPQTSGGRVPALLSQTGAFSDVRSLTPSAGLIPYDLVEAFWSDGAQKSRWVAIPNGTIGFSATGEWRFPKGTVFVKTFELPTDAAHPEVRRRLETRLLVCDAQGGVYGVVYKWRADLSDADLLPDALTEAIPMTSPSGRAGEQTWYYPSRKDCLTCHNRLAGGVLGLKTRQLNRSVTYPSGIADNQLREWNHLGLFEPALPADPSALPKLAAHTDDTRSLEDRARSYLDANCAHCHRPGGTVAYFDARYETPLAQQQLINGAVLLDEGIDHPRVIAPNDIWRSIAFMRADTNGDLRMPPIARETIDRAGVALLQQWIESLPGRAVLAPPSIAPAGGTFARSVEVTLQAAVPGADIRYTLDGSEPGPKDARYEHPIKLQGATVLRTRAYKDGFTHSITAQEVFIIGQ